MCARKQQSVSNWLENQNIVSHHAKTLGICRTHEAKVQRDQVITI